MPLYGLSPKGKLLTCKRDCKIHNEHYFGSFESAMKFFNIKSDEIKPYREVGGLIWYYQTNDYTAKRLSNELFDIMVRAQQERKYFAPDDGTREINAINALNDAYKMGYIIDEELLEKLRLKAENDVQGHDAAYRRIIHYKEFKKTANVLDYDLKYELIDFKFNN